MVKSTLNKGRLSDPAQKMPFEDANERREEEISNFDAHTDDLSSISHGLTGKLLPTSTILRPSMMKTPVKSGPSKVSDHSKSSFDDDDDEDFFDALD